jgi:putative ABC transport system substrate-binding protein
MERRKFITLFGGATTVWPLVARAQQPTMPVIGFLSTLSPDDSDHLVSAFRQSLGENGFLEGRNVAIEFRWARGDYNQLPELVADLVNRHVTVILAVGGDASIRAAKAATSTIPTVFAMGGDPVAAGLVASFNRPGGNFTGVSILTNLMESKRLGLLHELVPAQTVVGVVMNPNFSSAPMQLQELEEAAGAIGQRLVISRASNDAELEAALELLVRQGVGALLVTADPYFSTKRARFVAFALQNRLPAMYEFREYATAGGLLSYGVSRSEAYHIVGTYTAKILKGAKPADLPVQQLVKFELVINLKTAKAIGFEFPPTFSARADEIIE